MSFDQPTRNRLARFVGAARTLLTSEFTRQLQHEYGLDPTTGAVSDLTRLSALDDSRRQSARLLRITLDHYLSGNASATGSQSAKACKEALERIVREQAFTVLNRLSALRMAESRGLLIESIARGYQSKGFQLYARLAGTSLGETGDAYRAYLFSLFDEFAIDLPVLFDRFSPQGRLFPRPAVLLQLLDLINNAEIAALWTEDETIGWIYQYFNSKEERKQMRDESQAPRNSRELAVRNQFFTPRYVVEFLTDNTLGRIWYEMTQGSTTLIDSCRYLVRRPHEIFLAEGEIAPDDTARDNNVEFARPRANHATHPDDAVGDTARGVPDPSINDEDFARPRANHATHPDDMVGDTARGVPDSSINDEDFARPRANHETDLSQEELLRQPVYIPYRPRKDPRTILMLDPACGSMHFGLYSFDLYEVIYDEAWEIEAQLGANALLRPDPLRPLHETYPDKATFLRDVPRLIIEQNIHGIDIDPRAVQIAGLSLWLRAQKSWHALGVKPQERPQIARSNIVCAEPMPGDRGLLEEFLKSLREERLESLIRRVLNVAENQRVRATPTMADALCDLVRTVWKEMELAGEAGSLLKIEESLAAAIAKGRQEWDEKLPLFRVTEFSLTEQPKVRLYKTIPGEEEDFWDRAEALVLAALAEYAAQEESSDGYRRRLFVNDAACGFAFIDLCRKRYDVVLMNPPFGASPQGAKEYFIQSFKFTKNDLYAMFVERGIEWLNKTGRVGAITSRTGFSLETFQDWREKILLRACQLIMLADLGSDVLDNAMVEVASYVLEKGVVSKCPALFYRLLLAEDKGGALEEAVVGQNISIKFNVVPSSFLCVKTSPFAYWIPNHIRTHLEKFPSFEPEAGDVRCGLSTNDNPRFVRLIWEVPPENHNFCYYPIGIDRQACRFDDPVVQSFFARRGCGRRIWSPHVMSGASQPWFAPLTVVVNWENEGQEIKAYARVLGNSPSRNVRSEDYYFRPGISWTRRAVRMIPYVVPGNAIPTASRYMAFPNDGLEYLSLGYMASNVASAYLRMFGEKFEFPNFLVDNVKSLPWPKIPQKVQSAIETVIRDEIGRRRQAYMGHEPFHEFTKPFFLQDKKSRDVEFNYYSLLGESLDMDLAIAYGLSKKDFQILQRDLFEAVSVVRTTLSPEDDVNSDNDNSAVLDISISAAYESNLSYAVGCSFGRWDIRFATGEKYASELSDPFAPLPVCPPGMLQNAQGLPATQTDLPITYPLLISWSGILVDDEGHPEDIERRIREVIRVIWQDRADAIEQEACEILGVHSLRDYFRKPASFFDNHLKRYSKSRRSAPIYWPLSTPSGSYMLWLYYHRLSDQTLYTCVNDFVDPKLKQVRAEVNGLRQKSPRSSGEEKELERLSTLEGELNELRSELLRIASFWQPNLNDGVQITAAPLWKLFQHRAWQKKLKETWGKLTAGDYDWAHLAYSIWPERVAAKCKSDKSLAIAHDLEHLYVEPPVIKKANTKKKKEAQAERLFEDEE